MLAKTPRELILECLPVARRALIGALQGSDEGLGHPSAWRVILERPGANLSFKKMIFNFEGLVPCASETFARAVQSKSEDLSDGRTSR